MRDKVKKCREKGKKNVRITRGEIVSEKNGASEVLFTLER